MRGTTNKPRPKEATVATINYAQCPCCNSTDHADAPEHVRLSTCLRCNAIFGQLYLGDSYTVVLPYFVEQEPADPPRYFDFVTIGSKVDRRHGWYDVATKRIVQVG